MSQLYPEWIKELSELRSQLAKGDNTTQAQLDEVCKNWEKRKKLLIPGEKEESFTLVDSQGREMQLTSPRWLCHLLGLRHRCAHVLLQWQSPGLGRVFILQVRSWTKSDSAGHLDISVGGHVQGNAPSASEETANREMEEELGLTRADLKGGKLISLGGYESYDECAQDNFYNAEWRDVYVGEITTTGLDKIHFKDNEVVGLYFCPESEASNLLKQKLIPIASALELSLPRCLSCPQRGLLYAPSASKTSSSM